uniref:Uncharacterized protein n=1 Tax=viral metagenome TaxID=1070528 RepID=A0A6C0DJV4_9ZZZZ
MDWRTKLSEEIQQMKHRNNSSRFAGGWGYTSANIEDCRRENERIDKFAKDKIDHFHKIEMKELEEKIEAKNKYLKDILLALPYIKDDIQSILDKYPPVFQVEKAKITDFYTYLTDCPGISREKTVISGHMLTDLYEVFTKCLGVIKSKKQSQVYNDYVDRIYNKSTVLEGSSKTSYDHIISRAQALHFLYDTNTILDLLIENGISHEYTDKPSTGQPEITELYMKIGTRYLRLFIKPQIDKKVDDVILNSYGKSSAGDINGIKHYAINHIRTTTRINELSKLELKRQEQELIDAEVERRLKKKQFEKKVLATIQEKEQLEKEKRFTKQVQKFQSEERDRVNIQGDNDKDLLRSNKKRSPEVQRAVSSIVKTIPSNEVIELKHQIPQYFNLMKKEIELDEIHDYLKDIRKYDKYIQI